MNDVKNDWNDQDVVSLRCRHALLRFNFQSARRLNRRAPRFWSTQEQHILRVIQPARRQAIVRVDLAQRRCDHGKRAQQSHKKLEAEM